MLADTTDGGRTTTAITAAGRVDITGDEVSAHVGTVSRRSDPPASWCPADAPDCHCVPATGTFDGESTFNPNQYGVDNPL